MILLEMSELMLEIGGGSHQVKYYSHDTNTHNNQTHKEAGD
jgi:hypothetical protein